jgi:hypothetical protein
MFFDFQFGPFGRNPRTFNKIWGEDIIFAACGLAIPKQTQKQRAKLDKLIKLEELDALKR